MKNLLPLPDELLRLVYLYDPTYKEIFNICLVQLRFYFEQIDEYKEFLVEQELQRNMFTLTSDLFIDDILNNNTDDQDISFFTI